MRIKRFNAVKVMKAVGLECREGEGTPAEDCARIYMAANGRLATIFDWSGNNSEY